MSKYKLIDDQFKDKWINKPNNMGDVGDLQDITDELNNLLHERDEARELLAKSLVRGDLALEETKKSKEALLWSDIQDKRALQRERDEARHKLELCMAANSDVARIAKERDEAKAIAKEAITGLYTLGDYDLANRLSSKLEEAK
jgi:hypothetical protein